MAKRIGISILIISVWCNFTILGMENTHMPPAKVVVSEVRSGTIVPEAEFVGTVYYPQVSDVASEVSGKVDKVNFEEGDRIKKGHLLVKINSDLIRKDIQTKRALYEQALTDLELARRDLKRI
jgi:multidrug efflux pump subunit AcrA (membrane-fusion protein)